jgi:esterase/lipase
MISSFIGCIDEINEPDVNKKTKTEIAIDLIYNLSEEKYDDAYSKFNQDLKNALSLSQLKETWKYILNLYGDFQEIKSTLNSTELNYSVIFLNATFSNNYLITFKIVFDEDDGINGFWITDFISISDYFPPTYVNLQNFTEEDILIGDNWKLPATMSIPKGNGPFPGVILVHGSGPNDRDETIGPNKPFKDIAWGLASQGIIVLRYEKRTYTYSEEMSILKNITVREEVIEDAILAANTMKNYQNVDENNLFVIGHSLGGMLAPRIASQNDVLKGIAILAGPARKIEDLLINQTKYIANIDGKIDENESIQIDIIQDQVKKIKDLNINENESIFGAYRPYWDDLNNYNQVETAKNLSIDIFIVQGERDYQVTLADYNIWLNSIGSNDNVELILYPQLNHLFISGTGNSTPEEYLTEGHVDNTVIEDITNWIFKLNQR